MDCMVFLWEPAEKEGTNHGGLLAVMILLTYNRDETRSLSQSGAICRVMILLTYHRDETAEDICLQQTKGI